MSVLFFVPHLYPGGVSTVLLNLLSSIATKLSVIVIVGDADQRLLSKLNSINNLTIYCSNADRSFKSILYLVQKIIKIKPDLCIGVQGHGYFSLRFALFISLNSSKIFSWEHSTPSRSTQHGNSFKNNLYKLAGKVLYKFADGIIAVSVGVKQDFAAFYSIPESRINVLKNPILDEPSYYDSMLAHRRARDNCINYLYVGRLSPEKGLFDILRAFSKMPADKKWQLTIVGTGPDELALRSFSLENCLTDYVIFAGHSECVEEYYLDNDVLILASQYEGLPTVLVEASAYGLILISTDCESGPREIILNGVNGLLVPVGNSAELFGAIIYVGSNIDSFRNSYSFVSGYSSSNSSHEFIRLISNN